MTNRYISDRVLRQAYNAHAAKPASEDRPVASGLAPANELYLLKDFFRAAKGQEKGMRTYAQRIRRMHDMYNGLEQDPAVSAATRAFAKDVVENYMVSAYNAQRRRHARAGAAHDPITLDQVLGKGTGAKDPVRSAEQARSASDTGSSALAGFSASASSPLSPYSSLNGASRSSPTTVSSDSGPAPYDAEEGASPIAVTPQETGRRPGFLRRMRNGLAAAAGAAMLVAYLGMQPRHHETEAAAQAPAVAAAAAAAKPQAGLPKRSAAVLPSLEKIVFSVDDHDPATQDPVYTVQNGRIRSSDGQLVTIVPLHAGDGIVTDLGRSVFNPKPGETIDIGWRNYGPDGKRGTADDTRFRRGSAISITSTVNLESFGFTPSGTGAGRGALFYMAEPNKRKITESVAIQVELTPRPAQEQPKAPPVKPVPLPANPAPPVTETVPTPVPQPIPPPPELPAPIPAVPIPAGEGAGQVTYIRSMVGTTSTDVAQDQVALAPVDPHFRLSGKSFRLEFARLTDLSAFNASFERSKATGSSRYIDTTLFWTHTNTAASADLKYSLTSSKGIRPFVLAGVEAESSDTYMTNRLNFEPGRTTWTSPKAGFGIVYGGWNGTNAYFAVTGSRTSESNRFYENGWAWGNPHVAAFGMTWGSLGAEAGLQKMSSKGMAEVKASFQRNVTSPEQGFRDQRFRLSVAGAYDLARFGDMTIGFVGRAGMEVRDKRYADPLWNYSHTILPTAQAGLQLKLDEEHRPVGAPTATRAGAERPGWEASIAGMVGRAENQFREDAAATPSDVGDGAVRGPSYGLEVKLRTDRMMITAAGSQGRTTDSAESRTLSLDQMTAHGDIKLNLTTATPLKPFVLAGYSLEDNRFIVNSTDPASGAGRFRNLSTTQQGWEFGGGLVLGDWTGNNAYASLSVKGLQESGDSRNNLRGWGKPDVVMGNDAWKEGTFTLGGRHFFGDLELEAEGFYSRRFSATATDRLLQGYGVTSTFSYPVWKRPNWSLGLLGRGAWESRPNQLGNPWLDLPKNNTSFTLGVRFNFGGGSRR